MAEIDIEKLKEVAAYIIIEHTKDIEYLSILEMTETYFSKYDLPSDELGRCINKIDFLVNRKAKITVEFED